MSKAKTLAEFVGEYSTRKGWTKTHPSAMLEFAQAVAEFVYKKIRPSLFYTGDVQRADEVAKALGIERKK